MWIRRNTQQIVSVRVSGHIQIRPRPPVCAVTTKSITVPFGPIRLAAVVGSVTPEKAFGITIECTGAAHGGMSNIYVTMTDVAQPSNRGHLLTLAASSDATGEAVQILSDGTPVKFGPDSSAENNTNQWFVRRTGDETYTIPVSARYIRTGTEMKPGVANVAATFTMSYQ
ncbi:type 1 fimbrial protein [Burkholderia cenocepacia]|uniref:fimbrial protein n=1 Tax=Burkholderia cenocepacia TaxID=95486 RepID=UPI001CF2B297|nr:fimbrial protein [Burkholderia cenocepacia]MCA7921142.1 type 1 fimbrial protein [Burkholderia cenocepacia]